MKTELCGVPPYDSIRSLLTIHNIAYQGNFWHWDMELTGIDWKYFNWRQMEFYGNLSFLKTGLAFADTLTTVSPRYAEEIQRPPLGCGLEGILQHRRDDLFGIINGVDYSEWNPETDPHLGGHNYGVEELCRGQAGLQSGAAARDRPAASRRSAAGGDDRPAGRPEGLRPGRQADSAVGAELATCSG